MLSSPCSSLFFLFLSSIRPSVLICYCDSSYFSFQTVYFRDIAADTVLLPRQSRRDSCHISISCCFYGLSALPLILCFNVPCGCHNTGETTLLEMTFFSPPDVKFKHVNTGLFRKWFQNMFPSLQTYFITNICKQYGLQTIITLVCHSRFAVNSFMDVSYNMVL